MNEIILATNNQGKIAELSAILAPIHCISQASLNLESIEETGLSFVENALLKARFVSKMTNKPCLADDSGLVVEALNGEPGIYSARYAAHNASDKENNAYLLEKLKNSPDFKRQAYFYCALALIQQPNDPTPLIACGLWRGFIAKRASGEQGFGYDAVFYIPSLNCTAAQLPANIKNSISHRAEALKQLRQQLSDLR